MVLFFVGVIMFVMFVMFGVGMFVMGMFGF